MRRIHSLSLAVAGMMTLGGLQTAMGQNHAESSALQFVQPAATGGYAYDTIGGCDTCGDCGWPAGDCECQSMCDSCGCDDCCSCCCLSLPTWRIRAGAIFMSRDDPTSRGLIVDSGLNPVVNTSDFDFDMEPGWEINVVRSLGCRWGIEFCYFHVDGWSDTIGQQANNDGFGFSYLNGLDAAGVFSTPNPPHQFTSTYQSKLENVEVHGRYLLNACTTLLAGFRYVNMSDDLTGLFQDNAGIFSDQRIQADNKLYGFQVGAEATLLCLGNLMIEGVGKAGIYGNDASNRISQITNAPFAVNSDFGDSSSETSFVGELELTGVYQITPCWAIRGGYRVLLLDNVAFATEQLNINQAPPAVGVPLFVAPDIDASDDAVYQGASIMLEYTR